MFLKKSTIINSKAKRLSYNQYKCLTFPFAIKRHDASMVHLLTKTGVITDFLRGNAQITSNIFFYRDLLISNQKPIFVSQTRTSKFDVLNIPYWKFDVT
jgi:hypothetical protein